MGRFQISGVLRERETGRPLPGLIVRAFDRDPLFDDLLGFATSDADGRFRIRYTERQFRDVLESRPDVYLRVLDAEGVRVLRDLRDEVRRNSTPDEHFEIEIPAKALAPG